MADVSVANILKELDSFCTLINKRVSDLDALMTKVNKLERGLSELNAQQEIRENESTGSIIRENAQRLDNTKAKLKKAEECLRDATEQAQEYADSLVFRNADSASSLFAAIGSAITDKTKHQPFSYKDAIEDAKRADEKRGKLEVAYNVSGTTENEVALINAVRDQELAKANLESWRNRVAAVGGLVASAAALAIAAGAFAVPILPALSIGKAMYDVAKPVAEAFLRAKEQPQEGRSLVRTTWEKLRDAQFGEGSWDNAAKGLVDLAGSIATIAIPGADSIIKAVQAGVKVGISIADFRNTKAGSAIDEGDSLDEANKKIRATQEKWLAGNDLVFAIIDSIPAISQFVSALIPIGPIADFYRTVRDGIPFLDFYNSLDGLPDEIKKLVIDSPKSAIRTFLTRADLVNNTATVQLMRQIERKRAFLQARIDVGKKKLDEADKRNESEGHRT